jgi:hypothetical protein
VLLDGVPAAGHLQRDRIVLDDGRDPAEVAA